MRTFMKVTLFELKLNALKMSFYGIAPYKIPFQYKLLLFNV